MRVLRRLGNFIWRFMVIFSFIVNIILVIVLLAVVLLIFQIKNQIAQPLVTGLHSSFVGLDQATIDWTIPVRADVPVILDIPLQQNTIVTLTDDVPLTVSATIMRQGVDILGGPVTVILTLPRDTELPVALDLNVPVRDQVLPVSLDVRAVIPLQHTQLHDVADNLRLLFEPLAVGLVSLPSDFGEVLPFAGDLLAGNVDLLNSPAGTTYLETGWPGYSLTAGLNYPDELLYAPVPAQNVPVQTGIVQLGGIPLLDEQIRPTVYAGGGPLDVNQQAYDQLIAMGINPIFFNGRFGQLLTVGSTAAAQSAESADGAQDAGIITPNETSAPAIGGPVAPPTAAPDSGVIPTPSTNTAGERPPENGEDTGIIPTPGGGG